MTRSVSASQRTTRKGVISALIKIWLRAAGRPRPRPPSSSAIFVTLPSHPALTCAPTLTLISMMTRPARQRSSRRRRERAPARGRARDRGGPGCRHADARALIEGAAPPHVLDDDVINLAFNSDPQMLDHDPSPRSSAPISGRCAAACVRRDGRGDPWPSMLDRARLADVYQPVCAEHGVHRRGHRCDVRRGFVHGRSDRDAHRGWRNLRLAPRCARRSTMTMPRTITAASMATTAIST